MAESLSEGLVRQGFSLIETHISQVFLGDRDVYKVKRPVDLGFLDFSTLALREQACAAEVVLNRRLAPDVYHGVVGVVREQAGRLTFLPRDQLADRPVLEWAVHMTRLPDRERLDVRLEQGALGSDELMRLAGLLVDFHARACADQRSAAFGAPAIIACNVEENFAQTADLVGDHLGRAELEQLMTYQRAFLRDHAGLFEERARTGFVRDGHGDLRLEHVYRRGDTHVIIDCIEFNQRFRFADVCADLAFLTMDLKNHGRPELAELLAAEYARLSDDYALYGLLDFYESYRAFVRAKVSSLLANDANVSERTREQARKAARGYFLLALSAAEPTLRPGQLIVCMGMIASGKSTLAEGLGRAMAIPVLSADWTRKKLLALQPRDPLREQPFQGAYGAEVSERVYATLRQRAELVLRSQRSVIIDATFRSQAERAAVLELARSCAAQALFVECVCPREVALDRLRQRADGPHVSDGRAEVYDAFAASFDATSTLPSVAHLVVDTTGPVEEVLATLLREIG
jgi:uncharacterized protein